MKTQIRPIRIVANDPTVIRGVHRSVISGNFLAWVKAKALPLDKFKNANELMEADLKLVHEYLSQRSRLFLKVKGRGDPSGDAFEEFLRSQSVYHDSKEGRLDRKICDFFLLSRYNSYAELCRQLDNDIPKGSCDSPLSADVRTTFSNNLNTNDPVEKIPVLSTSPIQLKEEVDTSPKPASLTHQEENIPQIVFPAMILIRGLNKAPEDPYVKMLDDHKKAYGELIAINDKKVLLEKRINDANRKKEPFLESGRSVPKDILNELSLIYEEQKELEKDRVETTKIIYDLQKGLAEVIDKQVNKVQGVVPDSSSEQRVYQDVKTSELKLKLQALDELNSKFYFEKDNLRNELVFTLLDTEVFEQCIRKIDSGDFEALEKVAPRSVETITDHKVLSRPTIKKLKELKGKITDLEKEIDAYSPVTRLKVENELNQELLFLKKDLETFIHSERVKVGKKEDKRDELDEILYRMYQSEDRYFRLKIKLSFLEAERSPQRAALDHLISQTKSTSQVSREDQIMALLKSFYEVVRKCGKEIPQISISNQHHDPAETIKLAKIPSGKVKVNVRDSWIWRNPGLDSMFSESTGRLSCRVIGSPKMISILDEMSIKYDFSYKIPVDIKGWNREDPVTIYFSKHLHPDQIADIAQTMEEFVYHSDESMLGKDIISKKGVIKGIKYDETPTLVEQANVISTCFKIDEGLGKVASKYLKVEDIDGVITSKSSPGMIKAIQELVKALDSI